MKDIDSPKLQHRPGGHVDSIVQRIAETGEATPEWALTTLDMNPNMFRRIAVGLVRHGYSVTRAGDSYKILPPSPDARKGN